VLVDGGDRLADGRREASLGRDRAATLAAELLDGMLLLATSEAEVHDSPKASPPLLSGQVRQGETGSGDD
jgi:hypothetical protein